MQRGHTWSMLSAMNKVYKYFSYSASDLDGSMTVPSPHILSMASY